MNNQNELRTSRGVAIGIPGEVNVEAILEAAKNLLTQQKPDNQQAVIEFDDGFLNDFFELINTAISQKSTTFIDQNMEIITSNSDSKEISFKEFISYLDNLFSKPVNQDLIKLIIKELASRARIKYEETAGTIFIIEPKLKFKKINN